MASKESFTPEEWTKLLESPMLAGMAVSEPSGLWGHAERSFRQQFGAGRGET